MTDLLALIRHYLITLKIVLAFDFDFKFSRC